MCPEFSTSFNAVIEYLDGKGLNYRSYPEEKRVSFSVSGKNVNQNLVIRITHDDEFLQVTAQYPFFVREEKMRPSVAELLTRANYNMLLGNFEMDMKDGEIRYHVTHLIEGTAPSPETIDKIYMATLFTMDRYFPALMQHLHAGYTPEDAVFHAELDLIADTVQETPKPREKPKRAPSSMGDKPAKKQKPGKKSRGKAAMAQDASQPEQQQADRVADAGAVTDGNQRPDQDSEGQDSDSPRGDLPH